MAASRPLIPKSGAEKVNGFFYAAVAMTTIGAFMFGVGLGFTSPVLVSNAPTTALKNVTSTTINGLCPTNFYGCANCSSTSDARSFFAVGGADVFGPLHEEFGNSSNTTRQPHCGSCANKDKLNCQLQMSTSFVTSFASLVNFGCLAGALIGGSFADKLGKKKAMFFGNLLGAVAWLLIALVPDPDVSGWNGIKSSATNVGTIHAMLMTSRMLQGLGVGVICCCVNAYQVELSTLNLRGGVGAIFQLGIVIGIFLTYLVGAIIPFKMLAVIALSISVAGCIFTFFIPESPIWLLTKGRDREARAALVRVRDQSVGDLDDQLAKMKDIGGDESTPAGGASSSGGFGFLVSDKASRKALFIGVGLMVVQQFGGINAVMFYGGTIFQAITNNNVKLANTYATGAQALQLVVTGASVFFMDKAGRKPILLWAAAGQFLCSTMLGLYFFLDGVPATVAIVGFYGYILFFASGMGAIPWSIMAEIFDPKVKGLASSLATATNWFLSWVITFTVTDLQDGWATFFNKHGHDNPNVGLAGVFFTYAFFSLFGCFFVYFIIPETKNKEIAQILQELRGETRSAYTQIN